MHVSFIIAERLNMRHQITHESWLNFYVCMSVTNWNVICTVRVHILFVSVTSLTISLLCAWIWYESGLVCQRWQVALQQLQLGG